MRFPGHLVALKLMEWLHLVQAVDPRLGMAGFRPILKREAVELPTLPPLAVPFGSWPIPKLKPVVRQPVPADSEARSLGLHSCLKAVGSLDPLA